MSSSIIKEQIFKRDEDFGGGDMTQKCEYNSISKFLIIETDGQRLLLPVFEWNMLTNLVNKTLAIKGF